MSNSIQNLPTLYLDIDKDEASKLRFVAAMLKLIEEKDFAKISVQDICTAAGVSRQTFYRNFSSRYEIVNWFWMYNARRCFLRIGADLSWHDALELQHQAFSPLKHYFATCRKNKNALSPDSLAKFTIKATKEALERAVTQNAGIELDEQLRFEIAFFARSLAYAPFSYAELGKDANADKIATHLCNCVPRRLYATLENGKST